MDKRNEKNEMDFLTNEFQSAFVKTYIKAISKKIREAMEKKAEMGWYPAAQLPLGYIVVKSADSGVKRAISLDPNENNRKIVLREFELRANGFSYEKIREIVLAEKLLTPEMALKYTVEKISRRMENPFYRGEFIWKGKRYKAKHGLFVPNEWLNKIDDDFKRAG